MAITIPRAGTIAGQSASLAPAAGQAAGAAAETSGLMAEFGQRMLAHGLRWKAMQREQAVRKLQLDMTRDMGMAKLEAEQITDPTQVGPFWDAKTAELNAKYVDEQEDPEIRSAMGMAVQAVADQHAVDLAGKVVTLERSQKEADWITARGQIVLDTSRADPTTVAAMLGQGDAWLDSLVEQGILTPAQRATEGEAFHQEVWANRATVAIEADPEAFLAAAEAGEYDALGGTDLVRFKGAAKNEIDRRAERAASDREKAADARLAEMTRLFYAGEKVVDEAWLNDPAIMARPGWAEAMAAKSLRDEFPLFKKLPLSEQDRIIAAEAGRTKTHDWEVKRGDVLRAWRDEAAKDWVNDPGAAAQKAGLEYTELPEFDPSDPSAFAAGIAGRIRDDSFFAEEGYTKNRSAIFTNQEVAALKPVLDPKAEAGPKVTLMEAILQGAGGNAAPVLAELEADPVFRRGLKVLALTGDRGLTEAILRGQQKAEANTVILPSRKEQIATFDALTGGVFDDAPALKEEIMAATLALYADGAAGIDGETLSEEGWIADGTAYNLYGTAFQKLTGAQPDRNGNLTVGGLQELNGSLVVLPRGISVAEAETGWDTLTNRLLGGVISENWNESAADYSAHWDFAGADSIPMEARLAPFKAASLYGGLPDLGSDPGSRMAELSLRRVGESDVYELVWNDNGRLTTVPQAGTNHAYRFRLSDLLREAGK